MNDNDVIKALECCCGGVDNCKKCPYGLGCCLNDNYESVLMKDALDLINRQKEDINRLTVELQAMRGAANSYKMHYKKAQAEIESLKEENIILSQKRANIFEIISAYDRGRTEAIKEFAEALKKKYEKHIICSCDILNSEMDSLIKEMIQEDGGADA